MPSFPLAEETKVQHKTRKIIGTVKEVLNERAIEVEWNTGAIEALLTENVEKVETTEVTH